MRPRWCLAALVLACLALTWVVTEAAFVHTDDASVLETHCNACRLHLRTTGILTVTFSVPEIARVLDPVPQPPAPQPQEAAPRSVPSRGPPYP
jgi:hypothetical protein